MMANENPITITALPPYEDEFTSYAETDRTSYSVGDTCTLTAYPTQSEYLSHWTRESDGKLFYGIEINVIVSEDETYIAHFESNEEPTPEDEGEDQPGTKPTYTVTTRTDPEGAGTTTGDGTYEQGDTCTITATALNPARLPFIGWFNPDWDSANKLIKLAIFSFPVFDDEVYEAVFGTGEYDDWTDADEENYRNRKKNLKRNIAINVGVVPAYDGDESYATGGGLYYSGETCTLTAVPDTSVYDDNHLVQWKRTEGSSYDSPSVETRTANPYSFQVFAPNQYWWAIFGTGLTRITVSSNLPDYTSQGTGGSVYLTGVDDLSYKTNLSYNRNNAVIGVSTFKMEAASVGIDYEWYFANPQLSGEFPCYMPKYIIERCSGNRIEYPLGDVQSFLAECVNHYSGRIYYVLESISVDDLITDPVSNRLDYYIHFIEIGYILRNASGIVLRSGDTILRARSS